MIKVKESSRENIALAYQNKIYDLYLNGKLKTSFPDPILDSIFTHLVLIQHKNPKSILILGIQSADIVREALKHGVSSIDFISENPGINEMLKEYLIIDNKSFSVINKDFAEYARTTKKKYDLVIYRAEEPENLLLNRLYTSRVIKDIKKILNNDGMFVSSIIGDYYYMDNESLLFNKSHFNTLNKIFKNCDVVPGDNIYYFSSDSADNFSLDLNKIIKRYFERNIKSDFFNAEYFFEILKKQKADDFKIKLDNYKMKLLNKQTKPIFYNYSSYLYSKKNNSTDTLIPEFLLTGYSKFIIFFS